MLVTCLAMLCPAAWMNSVSYSALHTTCHGVLCLASFPFQQHIRHLHKLTHTHTNSRLHSSRVPPTPSAEISVALYQISSSRQGMGSEAGRWMGGACGRTWQPLVEVTRIKGGSGKWKTIEAGHIRGTPQLVAGHESQVSHCVQPLMKLWHHVILCELPFCTILVDSPAILLMSPRFGGLDAPPKGIMCSISRYLIHLPGKAGDRFFNALTADSLHCRDPPMESCSCPPSLSMPQADTLIQTHTQTHKSTLQRRSSHFVFWTSVALDQMSSRRPCTVSSHPTLLATTKLPCHHFWVEAWYLHFPMSLEYEIITDLVLWLDLFLSSFIHSFMALLEKSCINYITYLSTCTFMYRLMDACGHCLRYLFMKFSIYSFMFYSSSHSFITLFRYEFSWVFKCLCKIRSFVYS
jgi:hypothetical protein